MPIETTLSYYKNQSHSTRFNKETGELLHIFDTVDLSISIQTIEESQREFMVTSLESNSTVTTVEEFNVVLNLAKTKISNL
jgi:hypothetical protein